MSREEVGIPVFQLVYISAATCPFDDEALETLLAKARSNNESLGVSGMLVYHEGSFIQVLEGPQPVVQKLFDHIEEDERHTDTRVLFRGEVEAPSFGGWSMGFYRTHGRSGAELEGFNNFLPSGFADVTNEKPDLARRTLLAFREGKWRRVVDI